MPIENLLNISGLYVIYYIAGYHNHMETLAIVPYTVIEDRDFPGGLTIRLSISDFAGTAFADGRSTFSLRACRIKKLIIENLEHIPFDDILLSFSNCYIEDVELLNIASENISVSFHASIIVSASVKSKFLKHIQFNNCISESVFLIEQKSVHISYTDENIFPKNWKKLIASVGTDYKILLGKKQSYFIYDTDKLLFSSQESKSAKPGLYRKTYETIDAYKVGYRLKDTEKELLNINLTIKYSVDSLHTETKILNSRLNALSLSGYAKGEVIVEDTTINSWYLRDFSPETSATFYNIRPMKIPESKIEFHKSNLDKVWFDNIKFKQYSLVSFFRVKFGNVAFTACDFPSSYASFTNFKSLKNVHYPDEMADTYYKDQYEIFLQLRQQMESQGNFYESQKLLALSNEALLKVKDLSAWDKFILWTNSYSNNHGLSITRPFCLFLKVSILFYILYLTSLGRLFKCTGFDSTLIGYYFSFIDITHRSDFLVSQDEFTGWSLFFDYAGKIAGGYFIYQFIAAFRKYGKK